MGKKLQLGLIAGVVTMLLAGFFIAPVAAQQTERSQREEAKARVKERVQGRLDEAKKRVCANRSDKIKNIMNRAATQGEKHLNVFTKIADRVKEFYAKKQLTVANYEQLVSEAESKKAAAETAIAAVKSGVTFDCNDDNPVGAVDEFKGKVRTMHQALKNYRTAIKNLLVAVKNTASQAETSERSEQ
ncbi:MAG: hypothetical protein ACREGJ_01745 [Candidatus Saccharimonadales bacterium]